MQVGISTAIEGWREHLVASAIKKYLVSYNEIVSAELQTGIFDENVPDPIL
jgi:hypothetical protein